MNWWDNTVFYQIYIPSFRDGNNDGIGDFAGITEKLDYLAALGVKGIWLTPFYPSPKVDNGYDISDYTAVDRQYGDMESFERFMKEAKERDIKILIDMVINHTSTEHRWFIESKSSKDSPRRDWYIWRDEPNNWESFFSGTAWEYEPGTQQYYYRSFAKEQADLNWANPEVMNAFKGIFDFWLDKGVDGFRLDVINNLTIDMNFKDNPFDDAGNQLHVYDKNQDGLIPVLENVARHIKNKNPETLLVGEISSDDLEVISAYTEDDVFDLTFNFNIGSMDAWDTDHFFKELSKMADTYVEDKMPTLSFGSHDLSRSWDRIGENSEQKYRTLLVFLLFAKGVPFIYEGEELGMRNFIPETLEDFRDIQGINAYHVALERGKTEQEAFSIALEETRDGGRSPVDWEDEREEGKKYWIGRSKPNPLSNEILASYTEWIHLRNKLNLNNTDYEYQSFKNETMIFKRDNLLVYLNFGKEPETLRFDFTNYDILVRNGSVSINNGEISLEAYGSVVMEII